MQQTVNEVLDAPIGEEELQALVRAEIDDAVDYIEQEVGHERAKSTEYYRGDLFGNEDEGRSQVVSRDVRDAVQTLLQNLMPIFFGSSKAVEYLPAEPEDVQHAAQATDYVNHVIMQENSGYDVFYTVFKDAGYHKAGVVKAWADESVQVEYHDFVGLSDAQLGQLAGEKGVEIVEISSEYDPQALEIALGAGMPIEQVPQYHDVRLKRTVRNSKIRIAAVPPEEFLIDRRARSLDDARYVGHRTLLTVGELKALGYSEELVEEHIHHSSTLDDSEEVYTRHETALFPSDTKNPDARRVLYIESFVRVDMDNDGIAEMRKICTMGEGYEIVSNEPVAERPFAVFMVDPEPHTFFGEDLSDQTKDVQEIKSALLRRLLDSLSRSIDPDVGIVEGMVEMDDVLNPEVGRIIRMRQPGMVQPFQYPFIGNQVYPALEYLDQMKDSRVGSHNMALDADALQSTTKAAVSAQVKAAQQRLELIARTFAESGMKRLMKLLLKLVVAHQDRPKMVRLRNRWVEIDPRVWDADMDVVINVGLGNGLPEDKIAALREIKGTQEQILMQYGPGNPLVSLNQYATTLQKLTEFAGFADTGQFWNDVPPDWQPPPQQEKPSPEELLAQVEREKLQSEMQLDAAKLELERDKFLADVLLEAERIQGQYDRAVDVERIRQSVRSNRLERARGDG